jgi:ATP-dependent Clp protease ATP-binding subunit ClpA
MDYEPTVYGPRTKMNGSEEQLPNFTPRAQQALALARKETERFNHNFVGTEHFLLGLMALEECTAAKIMRKFGLEYKTLRLEIENLIGKGPDQKVIGNIPYTPRVKKVLALALKEATRLNHPNIGTGHILLGFLREGDGVAARILKRENISLEMIYAEVQPDHPVVKPLPLEPGEWQPQAVPTGPAIPKSAGAALMTNFTPRAQQVLSLARKEADRFHHSFVGTEHLLLGLIKLGQGAPVNVLHKLGLNLENVRAEVEKFVGTGHEHQIIGNIPYTPRVKKVVALAARQAKDLNHTYVGTEHILLGLLEERDGVVARVLEKFGVNMDETRKKILKELDPNSGKE